MKFRFLGTAMLAATSLTVFVADGANAQLNTIIKTGTDTTGINAGFGGVVGTGSSLAFNQNLISDEFANLTFTKGAGGFGGNIGVLYIATQNTLLAGFNSTATLTDSSDGGRRAVSGFNGNEAERATLNFASGFTADYALAFNDGFAALFQLQAGGAHTFIAPTGVNTSNTNGFTYDLAFSAIGIQRGQYFDYVVTLTGDSAYRANEFIGVTSFVQNTGTPDGAGNIGFNTASLGGNSFNRFVTVPEAGTLPLALSALSVLGAVVVTRRRSAK